MSTFIHKGVFVEQVDVELKKVCLEIADRYEIIFLEIGTDKDHVHFLVQSVPMYSPKKIVQIIRVYMLVKFLSGVRK